jgi:hypothetical protein
MKLRLGRANAVKVRTIQITLVSILVGSLLLEFLAIAVVRDRMWTEDFDSLILKLLAVYSAQIGLVIGGIVGENRNKMNNAPRGEALLALGLALVWTLLVGWRPIALVFTDRDSVKLVVNYIEEVGFGGSFFLASALAYFFASASTEGKKSPRKVGSDRAH